MRAIETLRHPFAGPRARLLVGALWVAAACVPATRAAGAGAAQELLMKMSQAMEATNYDGIFVYTRDGSMDTMRIIHRRDPDGVRERLVSLSGSAREVIRSGRQVVCIFPDDKAVLVERARPKDLFPATFHEPLDRMRRYYDFALLGADRVAGRPAHIVLIAPRSGDRYGYRLWIDEQSYLLLKSEVIDAGGALIEQVMFTRIDTPARIADELFEPEISGEGYTWIANESTEALGIRDTDEWDVGWLPAGFTLSERARQPIAASRMPVEHLVFSDGLAMVSVFVEKLADGRPALQGFSAMGAVNAFSTVTAGHQVTVVGEVPRATVRKIASSVVRRGKQAADQGQ